MKKFLLILISLIMFLLLVTASAILIFAIEDSDGPIAIKTTAEFMAMQPAGEYYLDANLTLESSYVGIFAGKLDGKGHTLTVSAPVFGEINGSVKDLTITGAITDNTDNLGALARKASGGEFVNITNNTALTSAVSAEKFVGGIIGYAESDAKLVFTGCKNTGKITGYIIGGIIGKCYAPADFTSCVNEADIVGGDATGGLIGWGVKAFTVKNCVSGKKDTVFTVSAATDGAAGIMGYVSGNNNGKFENCVNYMKATDTDKPAAGIAGRAGDNSTLEFTGCVNYGEIERNNGSYAAGGILGETAGSASFADCKNFGKVTDKSYRAAGIVGYIKLMGKFTNCVNYGEIKALKMAAGITANVGSSDVPSGNYVFEYCANEGNITATNSTAGGLCSYVYGTSDNAPEFHYCYNTGNVSGGEETGALIGYYNGTTKLKITSCYNTGIITGTGSVDSCALYYCNYDSATTDGNIIGAYYIPGCAKHERFDAKTFVAFASNITADDVTSGKLAYLLNQAAEKTVFYQTLTEDAHPVLDSEHKAVILSGDNYINATDADTTDPVTTEKPVDTTAPVTTEKPVDTTAPVTTEKPVDTTAPVTTEKPVDTTAPVTTEKPTDTTVTPSSTDAPVTTKAPEVNKNGCGNFSASFIVLFAVISGLGVLVVAKRKH